MIKIGDTAVSEEKVVDTATLASPKNEEDSKAEKKSTSTKKAKSKTQSRGTGRAQLTKTQEERNSSNSRKTFTSFLSSVKLQETLVFLQGLWQTLD